MDRELFLEIGCEELPASWLRPLTIQLGERLQQRLTENRLKFEQPVETFSTPRRLAVTIARVADHQTDFEETVSGPSVSAAFAPDGSPLPAALGFAKKLGVAVGDLERTTTPKGQYLVYHRRQRGKAAADTLPAVFGAVLRDLAFPKQMHWDAWLDDGKGELVFGRPIRWLVFLFGGRVMPFTIRRTALASSPLVQDVRSGASTYGHRFLAGSGRPGRAIRVRTFSEYRARLGENFVVLDRAERHDRIARELDVSAKRLGGRVSSGPSSHAHLLEEVADLVEYPAVVAGAFPPEFLNLPEEVLTTTMIHHQHYFPVVDDGGRLMPAFLAVTNIETDNYRRIAANSERVLMARLRDARFFWETDRQVPLDARLGRLETLLFHQKLGSYREKAERIEHLAGWIAESALGSPQYAAQAAMAGRLCKADLATDMVREFTELQGTMGGVYARAEGLPPEVWKAIYFHYLPVGVEPHAPPTREQLGEAAVTWAAVSLADKLDSVVGLFATGERPTGTRDPFGIRRNLQGALRLLVDLPELTGLGIPVKVFDLVGRAAEGLIEGGANFDDDLGPFVRDRLRHLFTQRGFRGDEIDTALFAVSGEVPPLLVRARLEALRSMRRSADFEALAVLFKRVRNIAREISPEPLATYETSLERDLLTTPAEQALLQDYDKASPLIRSAIAEGDYQRAMTVASTLRPTVDRFFTDVFVMVDDARLRTARLMLMVHVRDLILEVGDIAQLAPEAQGHGSQ